MEQARAAAEPRCPSLLLPFPFPYFIRFLLLFPLPLLQEAVSSLGKLDVLNPHINSLSKNLALNLPACNDAHSIPGHDNSQGAFVFEQFLFP